MTMKFYMTPGSCSTGIHILLEEVEEVFEVHLVDLLAGDQNKPDYLAINPNGTIPTLVCDGGITLTKFQSVALWLARAYPRFRLMPLTPDEKTRVLEIMNFAIITLHGEGFARIFTPEKFISDKADHEEVKTQGHKIVDKGFSIVNQWLADHEYVINLFTIADAALFYVEFWADKTNIPMPENCLAHYRHLLKRPAVRQVLSEEGYAAMFYDNVS